MSSARSGWTADELWAELRRRERTAGRVGGERGSGERSSVVSRRKDIRVLSTQEIARILKNQQRVVYGVDDRQEVFKVKLPRHRRAADSVVAIVNARQLSKQGDGSWTLSTESYQKEYDLCGSEPFVNQPIGCHCSGFLVAPDVIATAGHCVESLADLRKKRFVFGFRMLDAQTARTTFPGDDVYSGVRLLGRRLTATGPDWALIRLDRPCIGRTPLALRRTGTIRSRQRLFVIGHPCGLPQKYAKGAEVRDNSPKAFFVANLDTYGGNSGSPVFNAQNTTVEGILVRGENDFVTNGTCSISLVCPTTGCRGEDVTRATEWSAKVPKSNVRRASTVGAAGHKGAGPRRAQRAARKGSHGAKRKR